MRNALRQVWQRSKQWRIVKARCKDSEGYDVCEQCDLRVPKIFVDHTIPIGDMLEPGFIERLMVSSEGLKGLCAECHKPKTAKDNSETKAKKKARDEKILRDHTGDWCVDTDLKHPISIEPGSVNFVEAIRLDSDIEEMDLYTYEKIALQKKRNEQPIKFRLEDFI